ncbi:MAG: hypothetical protein HC851_08840 [Acaryochloris sp. RU_4_1]|nr:hypothetical protein [Acaryochloris sp. SU_5_25]NJM65743.1 hypothetical protein [Acaryochloris sp. RU_4_1]NJN38175.1 hypothetical protein [Acaryochloridaceae cyanobacterium CSU_3_4]NJR53664.1 hypothetical protein [Acaryochloris sp. CRU_2_0]
MMATEITQIQKHLDQLTQQTVELTHEARESYQQYLALLSPAVAQKLILASYHLCTQIYPEAFLQLSLNQQQTLQQKLQHLGQNLEESLTTLLQPLNTFVTTEEVEPEQLITLLQDLEQAILEVLRQISQQANQLLQDHQILEIKSMDLLFEIASKAAEHGRPITSTPHLIKALVDDEEGLSSTTSGDPVVAIFLQLSDLEFTDADVMNGRHQLRQLWQKLKSLQESFRQQQREKTIAEATAAWRASWFPLSSE